MMFRKTWCKVARLISRNVKDVIWSFLLSVLGRMGYESLRATYHLGYIPNFKNPRTFNERLIHAKFYKPCENKNTLADKAEVRHFVRERVGEKILNKVYLVSENPNDIRFDDLPNAFIVKTTHGSGGNIIVRNKNEMNEADVRAQIGEMLKCNFGHLTKEEWYLQIRPRFVIEELLMGDNNDIPFDYKFFCFHGECKYVQVNADRFTNHRNSFYDMDWRFQNFAVGLSQGTPISRPSNFEEMKEVARVLAKGFDFVRVDLYSVQGRTRFGEMTFTPGAGYGRFQPAAADFMLGSLWAVPTFNCAEKTCKEPSIWNLSTSCAG